MNNFLRFSIDNINFVDEVEKSFFRKIRIKAFSSGKNAHTLPVEEAVIRRNAKTIYNKPILWKYSKYFDDAVGHEEDEIPCGFVPENEDNPLELKEENGRLYIIINALIWTKYSGKLIDIFKRDGNKKDVSVEMQIIDNRPNKQYENNVKIDDFVIAGITILGEMIEPACEGCEAELLEFSKDKQRYLEELEFSKDRIEIDNSKESSVSGKWSNPRRKLFNPIIHSSNRDSLLKEAYLVCDFSSSEPEISKFKYPHHVIKDDKLILHKDGLEAAFSRASQQGIVNGDVKEHLLRHYKELNLSTDNFSDLCLNNNDLVLVGDFSMEENKKNLDMEQDTDKRSTDNQELVDNKNDEPDKEDAKMSVEEMECKMKEMMQKISELEECNKAYMERIDSMSDYEELKKFKCDTEERMEREKEMAEMEKVMSDIENRGVCMTEEEKKGFMEKIKDFSSMDAWSNYVKATVFDNAKNVNDVIKMGLPYNTTEKMTGSIWDEF